ncbi:MAG: radical SAM protein [Tannerella sp.]|jgi:organic radical activating enzyme|nr:radical SAM protein [Tannerella sp.]
MIFDSEQILSLLKSGNLHFNKIAAKTIVDRFDLFSRLFFDVIFKDDNNPDLILFAQQRFPSLNKGFLPAESFDPHKKYALFARYAGEHALLLEKLSEYFAEIETEKQKALFINRLAACFDGIIPDLRQNYPEYHSPEIIDAEEERQLMIFITGNCNLSCAYCFSKDLQPREMPVNDFEMILQWAKTNHVKKLSLCGGEPLVHSRFDGLLAMINAYDFTVYFASNMTVDCCKFENFRKNIIDRIFIHLTDQTFENRHLENLLSANIGYAKKQEIELAFRGNISGENPKWEKWLDLMQEHQIPALNIALTFPGEKARNQFVSHHDFSKFATVIADMIKKAEENNVSLSFAKPVPLCIFDDKMSSYLLARHPFQPLCNVYERQNTRNVSINCDMRFNPCLGITDQSLAFTPQTAWGEIEAFCSRNIVPLLSKPLYEKCNDCFLYARKLCQGACLSYKSAL